MRLNPYLACVGAAFLPTAFAWGAAGHEIVATIAQVYLHPTVMPIVCNILGVDPESPDCHLARVATWADRVRNLPGYRWSASLHYVGAKDDYPSQTCSFPGDAGWAGRAGVNVLGGVRNVTTILEDYATAGLGGSDPLAEEALKFLVHFVGDMHMPLHLTGRERGGNGIKVHFGRRTTNLHSVWDSMLIAKALRTIPLNYTQPLPVKAVEANLRGTIYDPYVRRVIWEGLLPGGSWEVDVPNWLLCPSAPSMNQDSSERQSVFGSVHGAPGDEFDDGTVCPFHWASEIHPLNCEIVWPKALDLPQYAASFDSAAAHDHNCMHDEEHEVGDDDDAVIADSFGRPPLPPRYLDLDTPEYAGVIAERRIVEKLMAKGGIRLAAILNWLFVDPDELIPTEEKLWTQASL